MEEDAIDLTDLTLEELDAFAALCHAETPGVEILYGVDPHSIWDDNPAHGSNTTEEMDVS